jgi:hypothetical protein
VKIAFIGPREVELMAEAVDALVKAFVPVARQALDKVKIGDAIIEGHCVEVALVNVLAETIIWRSHLQAENGDEWSQAILERLKVCSVALPEVVKHMLEQQRCDNVANEMAAKEIISKAINQVIH